MPFLERVIPQDNLKELQDLAKKDTSQFYFSDTLWVKIVYSFALAFHHHIWPSDQLMKSMIPLYLGRTASFVIEHQDSSAEEVEAKIEALCLEFERLKPYLLEHWH